VELASIRHFEHLMATCLPPARCGADE